MNSDARGRLGGGVQDQHGIMNSGARDHRDGVFADMQARHGTAGSSIHFNGNPPKAYTDDELLEAANRAPTRREDIESAQLIWSRYLSQHERTDRALVENWKGDADSILIFTGLFAATVGAFLVESYKSLKPDSGGTTAELLSQLVAFNVNGTRPTASSPDRFHASPNSVWVNVLWFSSLVLSLTCALGATLVQQWIRVYTQATQDQKSPALERGRSRAFLYNGVTRFRMPEIIQGMPLLLHSSVFLFFVGLVVFLRPIHAVVANIILVLVSVAGFTYTFFTLLPIVVVDSPYRTPFSPIVWRSLLPMIALVSNGVDKLRRSNHARSFWFFLVPVINGWALPTRFRKSMDAYHVDMRLYRSADILDFAVLTDAIGGISDGSMDEVALNHADILDSTSAFLRQHSRELYRWTGDEDLIKFHFLEPRFGNMLSRMISVPQSYAGNYTEPAFFRLLWELSTRYSYFDADTSKASPLKCIHAQVALHPDAIEFGKLPVEEMISSPDRIVAVMAVCLRAWTRYRERLRGASQLDLGHYRDVVALLYDLMPYYGKDENIHTLLHPLLRAYADRLHLARVTRHFFVPRSLRRRFVTAWTEIEAFSSRPMATSARQTIFIRAANMKAPTEIPHKRGTVVLSPSLTHYREVLESLRPYHDLLPRLPDAKTSAPPRDLNAPGLFIEDVEVGPFKQTEPSHTKAHGAESYTYWQPQGASYTPVPDPAPSPRALANAHALLGLDFPVNGHTSIHVTELMSELFGHAGGTREADSISDRELEVGQIGIAKGQADELPISNPSYPSIAEDSVV